MAPAYKALEIALEAENAARRFYTQMALQTSDHELLTIYRELAEFEERHTSFLEDKLSKLRRAAGSELA